MSSPDTTLRLVMPQWQGGDNTVYQLGSRLLAWLAPPSDARVEIVPVEESGVPDSPTEGGIHARAAILRQNRAARAIIRAAAPSRIVTFGGDCSVSLVPFAYLAEKYGGDVALLWIDSHTDISTPEQYPRANGYVARNLRGLGDPDFAAFATTPIAGDRLAYVGVAPSSLTPARSAELAGWGAVVFDPDAHTADFAEVTDWIAATGASRLLVHFDVDALDPAGFRSQLFGHPENALDPLFANIQRGRMSLDRVVDLLARCAAASDIVGLSITEHLPWDADNLRRALAGIDILHG